MTNKKNKILFLHGSNDLYGSSKVLIEIINILFDNGYEIHLVLPYEGPIDHVLKKKTIIYYKNLGVFRKKYFNFFGLFNRLIKILSSILFIYKLIKNQNIDVVYTNTSVIIAGGIAAKISSVSSYFHLHEIPTNKFYLFVIKNIINFCSDKVILVSKSVKNYWNFNLKSKTIVIYNGFNFKFNNKNKKRKGSLVFTSIGRLIPYKGHLYLLKIVKILNDKKYKFNLYIIGDTFSGYENYELSLKKYVIENNLSEIVFFMGYKDDVNYYLKNSSFFIHTPVDPDPLPTVILESISQNIPVIATKLGGAIEILNEGKGGLLIPSNNITLAVNLITEFIKNEEDTINRNMYARKYLKKHFSKEKFKENILSLFQ